MGVYLRGNELTLVRQFFKIDPITGVSTPTDPTTVTFTVVNPDGVSVAYVFGVDGNVTNPSVGTFLCALDPQLPPGDYTYAVVGTGTVVAQGEGSFTILESGALPPSPSTVATYGPCNGWITGDDVAAFDDLGVGSNTFLLDDVAEFASQLMYECSGRQFPGICQRTVRPCRDACACFGYSVAAGLGPWYWASSWAGWGIGGWAWRNECGDKCGCGNDSYIDLGGYPVREILQVKIDGVVISPVAGAPAVDGNPAHIGGYRLDARQRLIRLAIPGSPGVPVQDQFWPACQDMSLSDTQPGTYSVTYTWGGEPPAGGKMAAAQMAAELWKASPNNTGTCRLPSKVTRIVRNGITMEKVVPIADLIREGATGLPLVDAFVGLVNPSKSRRRNAVFSPDLQTRARKVGQ